MTLNIINLLDSYPKRLAAVGSPSDSFEVTLDILGNSTESKILGELVYFQSDEDNQKIVSIGQITEVVTSNKWHEEPSFKAVIKRHGSLPHLSKDADNRIATLNVQSTFKITSDNVIAHKLSNSPSTGTIVSAITNEIMNELIAPICMSYKTEILGKAYATEVNIPFWFKHFGKDSNGAGDAYHIGVFGKTGSGKTTTAARMLSGYAGNADKMSFLILDPQGQFYNDNDVIHNGSFKELITKKGISNYKACVIPNDIALPNSAELFSKILLNSGFVREFFQITTEQKLHDMTEGIEEYFLGRMNGRFEFKTQNALDLLKTMTARFASKNDQTEEADGCSRYVTNVYSNGARKKQLITRIQNLHTIFEEGRDNEIAKQIRLFEETLSLFKSGSNENITDMVRNILTKPGYMYVINLASSANKSFRSENVQALIIDVILTEIISQAEILASEKDKSNCLVVMDEAHRYVNAHATDDRLKDLNKKIIDSVRTVRKYGIGHMFITQTIESIDDEVIQQMRVFAFGYGLTMGSEFSKIKQIINDDNAAKFYRSFIDPSSNNKFAFMFHGPISPLSFTGSPLFIEMN